MLDFEKTLATKTTPTIKSVIVWAMVALLMVAQSRGASAAVSIELTAREQPSGTLYSWSAYDYFDASEQVQSVAVIAPSGGNFGGSFGSYADLVTAVEGTWEIFVEFADKPSETLYFDFLTLPTSFPIASAPLIVSPVQDATVLSGQAFFPVLDASTIDPDGYLSRYYLNAQNADANFENGGLHNGFSVTLDPGFTETEFRFGYSNVVQADGLESNLVGDQRLLGEIFYWYTSQDRTITVSSVPEPASLAALLCVGAIGMLRRRRRS
ncbi:hypothetical protein Q31b_09990 [Novipirellula aureliae]|uniref:Ice-binding protein C-terminal domain-containing protein n=1 Tax=Novipirellula aureliae TaxID=2527966 RepID=A0A5C6E836_9BACT|nr:PEP-CTERM sorting domain-containing protein [Novipirellula aureliae]TWU45823.1 hypothetical protein Q31b_09990 [Novipirellula aureliae]